MFDLCVAGQIITGEGKLVDSLKAAESQETQGAGDAVPGLHRPSMFQRAIRIMLAGIALVVFLLVVGAGLLYFYLPGSALNGDIVSTEIEKRIETALGGNFDVVLGNNDIEIASLESFKVTSSDVQFIRKSDNMLVSKIDKVMLTGNTQDIVSGKASIETADVENVYINAELLAGNAEVSIPKDVRTPLEVMGRTLASVSDAFESGGVKSLRVNSIEIDGPVMGRKGEEPLRLADIEILPSQDGAFSLAADAVTALSTMKFRSQYEKQREANNHATYSVSATGLEAREWFAAPDQPEKGIVGADSGFALFADFEFDAQARPLDPAIKATFEPGLLRIGRRSVSSLHQLDLNLRLLLDRNQIELDSSPIRVGDFRARLLGGLKPAKDEDGYHGPLLYDLILQNATYRPTAEGEATEPAAFKVAGVFDASSRNLQVNTVLFQTREGTIEGQGTLDLSDPSPGIKMQATTDGVSAVAFKQFWPDFVSPGARAWVHAHVREGQIKSGKLFADIPPGVIFEIRNGAKLKPEEYQVELDMVDVDFRPFGELPDIEDAVGRLRFSGMVLQATLDKGVVRTSNRVPVQISKGVFEMNDFGAKDRRGEVSFEAEGDLGAIARISESKPLRVMERMKVTPLQFSGKSHADIAAKFPVGRRADYSEVEWNVLLELQGGKSKERLAGRLLSDANILVDANPYGAQVTGQMKIDGVAADINFVEPIGKSGRVKLSREISAVLDDKGREALGINLDPVVRGPVGLKLVQKGKNERYTLDFGQAELALPWVGWSKGKGIRASGGFDLKRSGGVSTLDNFSIEGPGFLASGSLSLDKRGLRSADLEKLKLNDGDDIAFKLRRDKSGYNIDASGTAYDARSVINSLVHEGGFSKAQGGRSVNLSASFGAVKGFGGQEINNAFMVYESRGGRLTRLDLRGENANNRRFDVKAQQNGKQTEFTLNTNDAGKALSFMNIYSRMQGGDMAAKLLRGDDGVYRGPVRIENFLVVDEPKLRSMATNFRRQAPTERGGNNRAILPKGEKPTVKFVLADALVERGAGYFNISETIVRSTTLGIAMEGTVYDERDRMDLRGTFMPAQVLDYAVSSIPLLGQMFANGRERALIGITYQLKGPRNSPELKINPLSAVAPGVFNRVFEYQK